jgi:ribosomal protein L14E/L6E/L27E
MEEILEAEPGRIVKANKGRDKNGYFIITEFIDSDYVYIANGTNRKVSRPKKKKLIHLDDAGAISLLVHDRLSEGQKVKNSDIRKVLGEFIKNDEKI